MLELRQNSLVFSFPEVHHAASCKIDFQRTLRIPDDNRDYPLPPGLGRFPVEHVDDFAAAVPEKWMEHGGVFIPLYQSEALWLNFTGRYPCAIKVAAGKINAISGETWSNGLSAGTQDYAVVPGQPWLDGFNIAEDLVRQFVAMPLGEGYTAEEQITGEAEHGGLQIVAYPLRADIYKRDFEQEFRMHAHREREVVLFSNPEACYDSCASAEMGLAPGGTMRQHIYKDKYGIDDWDQDNGFRCFVHLVNSAAYESITGRKPPHRPLTAQDYTRRGLPWFEHYSDDKAMGGSKVLSALASVGARVIGKGQGVLPDNDPVKPRIVKTIGINHAVREGEF